MKTKNTFLAYIALSLLTVLSVSAQRVNLAKFQATASDSHNGSWESWKAIDGIAHNDSRWVSQNTDDPHWLAIEFPYVVEIGSSHLYTGIDDGQVIVNYRLQYKSGASWLDIPGATVTGNSNVFVNTIFTVPVKASEFRLYTDDNGYQRIRELALFPPNGGVGYPVGTDVEINLSWLRFVEHSSRNSGYVADVVDGYVDDSSYWACAANSENDTLKIELSATHKLGSAHVYTGLSNQEAISDFSIQYLNASTNWVDIPGATITNNTQKDLVIDFTEEVSAKDVRFVSRGNTVKYVREVVLFAANGGEAYPIGSGVSSESLPTEKFTDFDDGFWKIRSKRDTAWAIIPTNGAYAIANSSSLDFDKQFQVLLNVGTRTYRFINRKTGKAMAVKGASHSPGVVVEEQTYVGLANQNWRIVDFGDGTNKKIINEYSGLCLELVDTPVDGSWLVQSVFESKNSQKFDTSYVTHYPKKGLAGWLGSAGKLNAHWGYNWDGNDGWLGNGGLRIPVQQHAGWPSWGRIPKKYVYYNSRARADHMLGFNEPDNTWDKAQNPMSAEKAADLWPRLMRMRIPLVSPSPASFGSWISNFMTKAINKRGLQVDYMGYHWYGGPNGGDPQGLINNINTIYNNYGKRPVWITEFSTVDWGGSAKWTEEDTYNFFAEFLWRSENIKGLSKFSCFMFSGGVPTNPWTKNGPRGNFLNNSKLTALGEIYAAWDGDQTVHDMTPYILHNKSTRKRVWNDEGLLKPNTIRVSDVNTQWAAVPVGNGNIYLVSLLDGGRMRSDGTNIDLAPPGTTGSSVEWNRTLKEHGWYFIRHPATGTQLHSKKYDSDKVGSLDNIYINVVDDKWTGANNLWYFVKPVKPTAISGPAVPGGLATDAGYTSVKLSWNPGTQVSGYTVYRSSTEAGPFSPIASQVTDETYEDTNVLSGETWFYRVSGTDWFGVESPVSSTVSAKVLRLGATVYAINCGGAAYTAEDGTVYQADADFAGGSAAVDGSVTDFGNTDDETLYTTERTGNVLNFPFAYNLPILNGTYDVTLHLAENEYSTPGQRTLDVTIENEAVITGMDLYAEAGRGNAHDQSFKVRVADGVLKLVFDADSKINAIKVKGHISPDIVMPVYYSWANRMGMEGADANPSLDLDNDGFTNMEEFLADSNPTNASSLFEVDSFQYMDEGGEQIVIQWDAKEGRVYNVSQSTNLQPGLYEVVKKDIRYPRNSATVDVSEVESAFLRVDVRLP